MQAFVTSLLLSSSPCVSVSVSARPSPASCHLLSKLIELPVCLPRRVVRRETPPCSCSTALQSAVGCVLFVPRLEAQRVICQYLCAYMSQGRVNIIAPIKIFKIQQVKINCLGFGLSNNHKLSRNKHLVCKLQRFLLICWLYYSLLYQSQDCTFDVASGLFQI